MQAHPFDPSTPGPNPTHSFLRGMNKSIGIYKTTYRDLKSAMPLLEIGHAADPGELTLRKQRWAEKIFKLLEIEVEIQGAAQKSEASIFVGNHLSYLDIPFLMMSAPHVAFVAKEEIKKWPLFGTAAKAVGTVFVNRSSVRSRGSARDTIIENLKAGQSVALFPSGTTAIFENQSWKKGAFEIAQQGQFWLQPFRIHYSPTRACAYIDDDFFLTHLIRLAQRDRIQAKIEFHKPIKVKDPILDCLMVQRWTQGLGEIY